LIENLSKKRKESKKNRDVVLICSPDGELHHLGADILESTLLEKGYQVYNATPSAPIEAIRRHIQSEDPDIIMISVTLTDNWRAVKRLIAKIREEFNTPIFVGGWALNQIKDEEKRKIETTYSKISILVDASLQSIIQSVKSAIR
jgi:methanogenic corrinoid protein MtbC1